MKLDDPSHSYLILYAAPPRNPHSLFGSAAQHNQNAKRLLRVIMNLGGTPDYTEYRISSAETLANKNEETRDLFKRLEEGKAWFRPSNRFGHPEDAL